MDAFKMAAKRLRRKTEATKEHFTSGDINAYSRALQALRKIQLVAMNLDQFNSKPLYDYHYYEMVVEKLKREDKHISHAKTYDKGANCLETLPTEKQIQEVLDLWWRKGYECAQEAHESLLNM